MKSFFSIPFCEHTIEIEYKSKKYYLKFDDDYFLIEASTGLIGNEDIIDI